MSGAHAAERRAPAPVRALSSTHSSTHAASVSRLLACLLVPCATAYEFSVSRGVTAAELNTIIKANEPVAQWRTVAITSSALTPLKIYENEPVALQYTNPSTWASPNAPDWKVLQGDDSVCRVLGIDKTATGATFYVVGTGSATTAALGAATGSGSQAGMFTVGLRLESNKLWYMQPFSVTVAKRVVVVAGDGSGIVSILALVILGLAVLILLYLIVTWWFAEPAAPQDPYLPPPRPTFDAAPAAGSSRSSHSQYGGTPRDAYEPPPPVPKASTPRGPPPPSTEARRDPEAPQCSTRRQSQTPPRGGSREASASGFSTRPPGPGAGGGAPGGSTYSTRRPTSMNAMGALAAMRPSRGVPGARSGVPGAQPGYSTQPQARGAQANPAYSTAGRSPYSTVSAANTLAAAQAMLRGRPSARAPPPSAEASLDI